MSEDLKEEINNLVQIDLARIKRLSIKGHYHSLLEEFEKLRLKFNYNKEMSKMEAIRFITLLKFFGEKGHSEAFKLSCQYMLERYVSKYGL